ncbi:MAG: aminoacyl-tRNA hydrolase [Candidatus Nanopelagicaceae bacterium]|jgi:PTH1 family peptidyl-tRNA hydrolase
MFRSKERWLVIGLGNPGVEYERTRHNIGAMVVSQLAISNSSKFTNHKSRADIAEFKIDGSSIVAAKLRCYMNESGGPTKSLADYFKVKPDHVIAIHDELDIPFESIRLKFGGGDNGHNGLKSITSAFGSDYFRIRMGIGRPVGAQDPADFVLKPFNSQERNSLEDFIAKGASAVESLVSDGLDIAQTRFNS